MIEADKQRQLMQAQRALGIKPTSSKATGKDASRRKSADDERRRDRTMRGRSGRSLQLPAWATDKAVLVDTLGLVGWHSTEGKAPWEGLFRQHWKDFQVTEMPSWGVTLSRELNEEIPPTPFELQSEEALRKSTKQRPQSLEDLRVRTASSESETSQQLAQSQSVYRRLLGTAERSNNWMLQCYLRKQHVPHAVAIATLSRLFRVPSRAISFAGIKDFVGDTIQRIRIRGPSAGAAVEVNKMLKNISLRNAAKAAERQGEVVPEQPSRRSRYRARFAKARAKVVQLLPDATMQLSHFSYVQGTLAPGHLAGNHFRIVLRDATVDEATLQRCVRALKDHGCANYYGSQRFSWFRGLDDAGFAAVQIDHLRFVFALLDFTTEPHSLRELLQRSKLYPNPLQNDLRHRIVRELKTKSLDPVDLDQMPRLRMIPEPGYVAQIFTELSPTEMALLAAVKSAVMSLEDETAYHLAVVRVPCLLWNLAVSIRRSLFGDRVLVGDFVLRAGTNETVLEGPPTLAYEAIEVVTAETLSSYTVFDVLHPVFGFHNSPLPDNAVKDIYLALCESYGLDWTTNYTAAGFPGLIEGPRRIAIRPGMVTAELNAADRTATIEFALPRGSYATVALREVMMSPYCAGQGSLTRTPLPAGMWDRGLTDPSYVETFEDIYEGTHDPVTGDALEAEVEEVTGPSLADDPSAITFGRDPAERARRFGDRNYVHALEARERDTKAKLRDLFEDDLAAQLTDEEKSHYVHHYVPLRTNDNRRIVQARLRKRTKNLAGAPKLRPKIHLGRAGTRNKPAAFERLYRQKWNFN